MIEYSEIFQFLADIAVVIAGLAGVATAFGGENRSYSELEMLRVRTLFLFSAQIWVGCLGLITMDAAGVSKDSSLIGISIFAVIAIALSTYDVPRKSIKLLGQKSGASVTPITLVIAFTPGLICIPLLSANALLLREEWPLIASYSFYILISIWAFYRILVSRN